MVDKLTAIKSDRIRERIGALNPVQRSDLDKALKLRHGFSASANNRGITQSAARVGDEMSYA